jgi:hypothetical protein
MHQSINMLTGILSNANSTSNNNSCCENVQVRVIRQEKGQEAQGF